MFLGRWPVGVLVALVFLSLVPVGSADVFVLTNGGRVQGRWLNPDDGPPAVYQIETPSGGRILLERKQVQQVIRQRQAELDFERIAPSYADTVDDLWALAQWCRTHRLVQQRDRVLRRILELDGEYAPARYALGYQQLNGQWVTTQEWRDREGYVLYRGRWRLAQDVELLEAERKRNALEKDWAQRLRRWREQLDTDKARNARAAIQAIKDPVAVKPIADEFRQEPFRAVRLLYVEALGQIASDAAVKFLIFASLNDLDEEVRVACVEEIVSLNPPGAAEKYIDALKDKNNVRINLAARALAQLGDRSAVGPLIDALVTTHEIVLRQPGRSADAITTSFQQGGGGSSVGSGGGSPFPRSGTEFSTGEQQQVVRRTVPNSDVLTALVRLTNGVNFSFDQRAWRYWQAAEKQQPDTQLRNARRD
jgi:hypothetical protein